jgi:extracellular elastinolytic metalloproteinase
MTLFSTRLGYRTLALATALALPGLAAAQQGPTVVSAFTARAKAQGLSASDVASPLITNSYTDASTGITHTYLQQRVNGLVVFNATGAIHTDKTGKVLFAAQDFVTNATAKAAAPTPTLTPEQAVVAASVGLGLPRPVGLRTVIEARLADGMLFNNGGISEENIPVRLMYTRQNDKLVLVWQVGIAQLDQEHYWNARIDATTGQLVDKNDFVNSEAITFRQQQLHAEASRQKALAFAPAAAKSVLNTNAPANSLTVVPVPYENPLIAGRSSVLLSSANPLYSPVGWQVEQPGVPTGFFADTYSLAPSGKFLTRGNNVAAYDDNSTKTSASGSITSTTNSPDGTSTLTFDFPFDQTKGPRDPNNLAAGITNLFYWNNMLHDVMMAHGFDEVSGNFQYKNLTTDAQGNKLGKDGDFVRAESQDGSGRNNANFSTPADGASGRMQMYLFDNILPNSLTVTGPATAAGNYNFATVSFGPSITKKPLAGKLVLVNDGVSADGGDHACATPFVNAAAVTGNIAFIQRGGCPQLTTLSPRADNTFAPKVKRAQANGATGVIVFDSLGTTTNLVNFGGSDTVGIRIPAIFISGADGFKLRAALLAGGNVNVSAALGPVLPDFDGSFDNGVVSHEFGHGVSNRLTGGGTAACLDATTGNQTMGEGWSDFFGLWMTTRPGDKGSTNRYVATYDNGDPLATGPGFRSKPYTTDMSASGNNYTYAQLGTSSGKFQETHDVGEIWATVLWDLNWALINKYGYNADFFAATGGNNLALRLVLTGCKLQVCQPGFLDGRDGILRADSATNRAANADLIWNVFARRGMGYSAKQGDRINGYPKVTNLAQAFDLPPQTKVIPLATATGVTTSASLEAYPNPAQDRLTVRTQLPSTAPMHVTVLDLLGKTVLSTTVPTAQMQQSGVELNTSRLATGLYIVRVATTEGNFTTKVTIQH